MPRSRNTRIRPKNTSRSEARRRHREEQRADEIEPNTLSDQVDSSEATARSRPAFGLPNVREDLAALPQVFRKPLVWAPFGLILLGFALGVAVVSGSLGEGQANDIAVLFVQFTLDPTSLIIFFVAGFVAPRASYLVGLLAGVFMAATYTLFLALVPSLSDDSTIEFSGLGGTGSTDALLTSEALAFIWGSAIIMGTFAAGFAAWYRRFLRSSQERARANRAIKEKDQAQKAKDQARADKQAARDARRDNP